MADGSSSSCVDVRESWEHTSLDGRLVYANNALPLIGKEDKKGPEQCCIAYITLDTVQALTQQLFTVVLKRP